MQQFKIGDWVRNIESNNIYKINGFSVHGQTKGFIQIPDEYNLRVTVKRSELLESIERASLIAKDSNTNLIKLEINEENMVITSNSQLGKVREEINIILQGEPLQIAFNSKYLIDVLKNAETEEVVMEFSSSVSPCIIKNKDNDSSIYLVLPVRLLNNI